MNSNGGSLPIFKNDCRKRIMSPIPINFNSIAIGTILVDHFRNEIADEDGEFRSKQGSLYHPIGSGKEKGGFSALDG